MFRSGSTKWIVSLFLVAIVIAIGITISTENHSFSPQTAISQTNDSLSQDFEYLERTNRAFIEVVNRAKPAVVQITTKKLVSRSQSPFDFFHGDEDPFHFWFGPRDRGEEGQPSQPEEKQEIGGLGSGVIVREDGYILTNNHVIEGADDIKVILPDRREFDAKVVGKDSGGQGTDLAVLKIDGNDLPSLSFGDSDTLQVGEWVIAIGSPFGLAQTVTRGMVSAKGRSRSQVGIVDYADFIQTDAAINRGNSGGALINIHGELVGINTAIATGGGFSQGNVGVGFAIPINLARRVMTELIEKGEVERGWLGVSLQPINQNLADKLKLEVPRGALVTMTGKGMPADKGGIRRGDVIVEFDGVPIRDMDHLRNVVATTDVGKTVEVKVIRDGKEKTLKITLGKRTEGVVSALGGNGEPFSPPAEKEEVFSGLYVQGLTNELAERYDHQGEQGVIVVKVDRNSPAAKAGVNVGDLIQEIENKEITNLEEYRRQIEAVKDESKVLLYVRHANGVPEYITLENTPGDK